MTIRLDLGIGVLSKSATADSVAQELLSGIAQPFIAASVHDIDLVPRIATNDFGIVFSLGWSY